MSKIIVVYPGRFQPFGKHHKAVFDYLELEFGKGNVFITSSNKTNTTNSPFNFEQKKMIATHLGIPSNRFIYCVNPYKADELKNYFNASTDTLVFVYSEKDANRLSYNKKDGSAGYFLPYEKDAIGLNPFSKNAYVLVAPKVEILLNGEELSGTQLRNHLKNASKTEFENQLGFYDSEIHETLKTYDQENVEDSPEEYINEKILFYQQYLTNLLPNSFKVEVQEGKLVVSFSETLNEIIMKLKDGRYRVYSRKLTKGKDGQMHRRNMGTYDSKKAAIAREEQIKDYMASINPESEEGAEKKPIKKENKILENYQSKVDRNFWNPIFAKILND